MNCRDVKEKLSEYVDGRLPRTDAAAVEKHLDDCAECKRAYETMSAIIRHMSRMGAVDEPEDFLGKLTARLDEPSSLGGVIRRAFTPLKLRLAGMAVAAAVMVYFVAINDRRDLYEITLAIDRGTDTEIVDERSGEKDGKGDHPPKRGKKGPRSLGDVIDSLGGRVIETKHGEDADLFYLIIEIPAGNYPQLVEELNRLGVVQGAPPRISEDAGQVVRIKIIPR